MIPLIASLLALVAGPLLAGVLPRQPRLLYLLDGFTLVMVAGLVLAHVLPDAVAVTGSWVLLVAAAGFVLPALAERHLHNSHAGTHRAVLAASWLGLLVHAALDGAALGHGHSAAITAIVLHRLPVGLFLWLTVRPLFGRNVAIAAILSMAAATAVGFAGGQNIGDPHNDSPVVAVLLALVSGGLLHVLVHQSVPNRRVAAGNLWGAAGGVAAIFGLAYTEFHFPEFASPLWMIGTDLAVAAFVLWWPLLAGGAVGALLVASSTSAIPAARNVWTGLWLGARTPVCSCGTLPVYEDLVGHRLPGAFSIGFLVGAPSLGIGTLALTGYLFGWEMALARVVAVITMAAVAAAVFGRRLQPTGDVHFHADDSGAHEGAERAALEGPTVLHRAARYFLGDWLDHGAAWFLAALLAIPMLFLLLPPGSASGSPTFEPGWAVVIASIALAAVVRLDGAAATVLTFGVVNYFAPTIMPPSWVLVLLLVGPVTGSGARRTLARIHGPSAGWKVALLLVVVASALGFALQLSGWETLQRPANVFTQARRVQDALFAGDTVLWAGLALLVLVPLASLLRCGPRGWLAQILPADDHDHAHHPGTKHDHRGREQVQIDAAGDAG